ncbi:MAG: TraB/GumN family protein, partial [Sedimenticola sp.]
MSEYQEQEPLAEVRVGGSTIVLLGTAHVSRASAEMVETLLQSGGYDAVAVELCPSRYNAIIDPDALARMDLFKVLKEGKASMVAANLA